MRHIAFNPKEQSVASEVYHHIKHQKSESLNTNNLAKFHVMMDQKLKKLDSDSFQKNGNTDNDIKGSSLNRSVRIRPVSLKSARKSRNRAKITLNSSSKPAKKQSTKMEFTISCACSSSGVHVQTNVNQKEIGISKSSKLVDPIANTPLKISERRGSIQTDDRFTFKQPNLVKTENQMSLNEYSVYHRNISTMESSNDKNKQKLSKSHKVTLQNELAEFRKCSHRVNHKHYSPSKSHEYGPIECNKAISLVRIPTDEQKDHKGIHKFIAFQMKEDILRSQTNDMLPHIEGCERRLGGRGYRRRAET